MLSWEAILLWVRSLIISFVFVFKSHEKGQINDARILVTIPYGLVVIEKVCWVIPECCEKTFLSLLLLWINDTKMRYCRFVWLHQCFKELHKSQFEIWCWSAGDYSSEMSFRMAALVLPRRFSSRATSSDCLSSIACKSSPISFENFSFSLAFVTFQSSIVVLIEYKGDVSQAFTFTSPKPIVTYFT